MSIALVYTRTRDYELELFRREYEGSARLLGNGLKKGVASKVQGAAAFSAHYTGRFGAQNPNRAGAFTVRRRRRVLAHVSTHVRAAANLCQSVTRSAALSRVHALAFFNTQY